MKLFAKQNQNDAVVRSHRNEIRASMAAPTELPDLADHFRFANSLSIRAALSNDVRKRIRERFRLERTQNSFLAGMVQSAANYTIGTGPRLQMNSATRSADREIEVAWQLWCKHAKFAQKLRTCMMSKIEGEAFGVIQSNPVLRQQKRR